MRQVLIAILFLGIVFGIYKLASKNKYSNNSRAIENFAVEDTKSVDRIILKDREGKTIDLSKDDGIWMVNSEYPAFKPHINILLNKTINKIKIKGPVSEAAKDNVIRYMVGEAIHVTIFKNNKQVINYYVGGANADQSGTYLHLEGSTTPYVAYIPGFSGVLLPRFSTDIKEWYSKTIFDYEQEDIKTITVTNNEEPTESFELTKLDSQYRLTPSIPTLSQVAAKSYFSLFKFKNFESYADYLTIETKDSIASQSPFLKIAVELKNGKTKELSIYRKGNINANKTLHDKHGDVIVQDVERYFATFSGFSQLVTIQEYTFGKLLVKRSNFNSR